MLTTQSEIKAVKSFVSSQFFEFLIIHDLYCYHSLSFYLGCIFVNVILTQMLQFFSGAPQGVTTSCKCLGKSQTMMEDRVWPYI